MDPELAALLTDTVQHAPWLGIDAYGKPTYGPAVARPARIEWRTDMGMAGGAREIMSETIVYLNWTFGLTQQDKIVLPDGSAPSIEVVEAWRDELGNPDYYRLHM